MKPKGKEKPTAGKGRQAEHLSLEKLQAELESLRQEKEMLFDKLQRLSADYANFQKRSAKQVADTIVYEKETIMRTLLPALDSFEHTLHNARAAHSTDVLVKGVEIIYDQILAILSSHGVEQIKALGEKFDPSLHEAVMLKADPEKQENVVLEEFQKGYKLNGRVIRPSKVVVNKLAAQEQDRGEKEQQEPDQSETSPPSESGQVPDSEEEKS